MNLPWGDMDNESSSDHSLPSDFKDCMQVEEDKPEEVEENVEESLIEGDDEIEDVEEAKKTLQVWKKGGIFFKKDEDVVLATLRRKKKNKGKARDNNSKNHIMGNKSVQKHLKLKKIEHLMMNFLWEDMDNESSSDHSLPSGFKNCMLVEKVPKNNKRRKHVSLHNQVQTRVGSTSEAEKKKGRTYNNIEDKPEEVEEDVEESLIEGDDEIEDVEKAKKTL
ncbi:hypothetical protein PIB30_066835 [Stylosanthes scabra]|uniref:Uncharacterized protein n=1 Tax=Stylosanthes scabra TaxID=79078 RepID=A0ABU6ZL43_9FABA|nr:hypothetical protein [Stylosanthes scabra]